MKRLAVLYRRTRRTVLGRRRLLAAACAAAAVAAGLQAAAEPPPPRSQVLTAARDLPAGTVLEAADLVRVGFAPDSVPEGLVGSPADALGRTTAGPIRAGEPVTDVRLVSGSMLAAFPGAVAAPVRIGDPQAVALLRVGDRVDVLAADPQGGTEATVVASDAPVIALPQLRETAAGTVQGGLVVLAISDESAHRVAAASVSRYLSVVITR